MRLIFATNNAHKLDEVKAVVPAQIEILSLSDVQFLDELPETSGTIHGNALQKAETFFARTGMNCFSDDTGLEVACLNGAPGVDTAFYSGSRDAVANNVKLLNDMAGFEDRSARFITVIACVIDGVSHLFEGEVKGKIGFSAEGTGGFGYDPVFIPGNHTQSFAALPPLVKQTISHRTRAVELFTAWLHDKTIK
jgi:XTP/dITP diphosphohydrolase